MDQNLIDYIKKSKEQGTSDEEIKKALLDAGWKEEDIEEGFKIIGEVPIPTSSPAEFEPLRTEKLSQPETGIKKTKKPPTTLISIVFLLAGIGHLISIPILLAFGLVSWAFKMMAIFSVISAILLFICFIGLRKMKSWYLKPFLMLFGLVIIIGLVLFFTRWNPIYIIEILILAIIFWILWRQRQKFGYQPSVKHWSFLIIGLVIGLILGGVILAETYHWITPKYEKIKEEIKKEETEKEKITEIVPEKWVTYINEEYSYQIDYPVDWILDGGPRDPNISFQTSPGQDCATQENCLSVTIEIRPDFSSLEEWIDKWRSDFIKAGEQGLNWEVKEGEILVGGRKGYEFIAWLPKSSIFPADHRVGVFENGKLYHVRAEGLERTLLEKFPKTFERIISSFKFTK